MSPEMFKTAAAMMRNMNPEDMQRMTQMAQRMQSGQQAGAQRGRTQGTIARRLSHMPRQCSAHPAGSNLNQETTC